MTTFPAEPIGARPFRLLLPTRMLRRLRSILPNPTHNLTSTLIRRYAMSSDSPETREVCDASELEDGKMFVHLPSPFLSFLSCLDQIGSWPTMGHR
jgi:hypothetical protein